MPIPDFMLGQMKSPSESMCYLLNESPFEMVQTRAGLVPRWTVYAERMAEHLLMERVMREAGVPPL